MNSDPIDNVHHEVYRRLYSSARSTPPGPDSTEYATPPPYQPPERPSSLPQRAGMLPWAPVAQSVSPPPLVQSTQSPLPYPGETLPPTLSHKHSIAVLTFSSPPRTPEPPASRPHSPEQNAATPPSTSLTAPFPAIPDLISAMPTIQQPTCDSALKVDWCCEVMYLVDCVYQSQSQQQAQYMPGASETPVGPVTIHDPHLLQLCRVAVPMIVKMALSSQKPMPPHVAEAVFLRAKLAASGAYPEHVQQNARSAFRDFEAAARAGHHLAWFSLGRTYEGFNDFVRAKDCYERGVKQGVAICLYRLGMAHLLGQLNLPQSTETALPLLLRAAQRSSIDCPHPAYFYALILLNEFTPLSVQPHLLMSLIPLHSTPLLEARTHLERSAYLHYAPAQYKLGHAYEHAVPPFEFDPILSLEWYIKASEQGEAEPDMALSKWFLCGSDGVFEKDERLAWVFAERAAKKGLASAEFALGYYSEVGVGGQSSLESAMVRYRKASEHGSVEAQERLRALSQPSPQALGRQEHETLTDKMLVRKRTLARERSEKRQPQAIEQQRRRQVSGDVRFVVAAIRQNILAYPGDGSLAPGPSSARHPQRQAYSMYNNASAAVNVPPHRESYGGRPSPNSNRYTESPPHGGHKRTPSPLSRPGSTPPGRPGPAPAGSDRLSEPRVRRGPSPASSSGKQLGPATFADMGIQGAALEDKGCTVM